MKAINNRRKSCGEHHSFMGWKREWFIISVLMSRLVKQRGYRYLKSTDSDNKWMPTFMNDAKPN